MYAVLFQLTTTWQYNLHQVKLLAARESGGRLWWIPLDLFKCLLLYNTAVINGQRLGISPGFYEHVSFVGNKSNRTKERIPGCSLQVRFWFVLIHKVMPWPKVWRSRTGSGLKKYFQASWSPRTGSQASFEPLN